MKTSCVRLDECDQLKGCVLGFGHFSTIHPGHIRYLKQAKNLAETFVVALMGDKGSQSFPYNQSDRAEALRMLGIADTIILLDKDELELAVRKVRPSVLVLGSEFKRQEAIQYVIKTQLSLGGKVRFHAGEIHYGTTELLTKSERDLKEERRRLFQGACSRHGIKKQHMLKSIDMWKESRLIVIGDTIVDQYAGCEALGMSAEAPVVVVKEVESRNFVGGAGVVAAHINALGAQCDLVSVVGEDSEAELIRSTLQSQGIGDQLVVDGSRPTTFKKRYLVENQKLFRVSRLEDHELDKHLEDMVISRLEELAPNAGGIVVSDFVYGVVTKKILEAVNRISKKFGLLLFGDLQCSSQVGSVSKFKNFSLLCPNEKEARYALQDKDSVLEQLSQRLLEVTGSESMIMKLGPEGFIVYERQPKGLMRSQAFPALSVNPVDVAGAGDSLLALFAAGLASGQSVMPTAALACCMSALAVERMGNTPISAEELKSSLEELELS